MLQHVRVPVLLTHHFRAVDDRSGALLGALSDVQANCACELIRAAGQSVEYLSFPGMGHSMHGEDPELFIAWRADSMPDDVCAVVDRIRGALARDA